MPRTIALVSLPDHMLTSYVRGANGATRLHDGSVPPADKVIPVRHVGDHFKASPGTVAALGQLSMLMMEAGMDPVRITEAFRSQEIQAAARKGYETWLRAGRPSPSSPKWRAGMKTAYVARAGRSNHGWGGAVDIDVGALNSQSARMGSNAALHELWGHMRACGFEPVINEPLANAAEAWHFDRLGPLRAVRKMYDEASKTYSRYREGYGLTAMVGCVLAGTLPGQSAEQFVQARLLVGGFWCGLVDGQIGPMTRAALAEAGVSKTAMRSGVSKITAELNRLDVGTEQLQDA